MYLHAFQAHNEFIRNVPSLAALFSNSNDLTDTTTHIPHHYGLNMVLEGLHVPWKNIPQPFAKSIGPSMSLDCSSFLPLLSWCAWSARMSMCMHADGNSIQVHASHGSLHQACACSSRPCLHLLHMHSWWPSTPHTYPPAPICPTYVTVWSMPHLPQNMSGSCHTCSCHRLMHSCSLTPIPVHMVQSTHPHLHIMHTHTCPPTTAHCHPCQNTLHACSQIRKSVFSLKLLNRLKLSNFRDFLQTSLNINLGQFGSFRENAHFLMLTLSSSPHLHMHASESVCVCTPPHMHPHLPSLPSCSPSCRAHSWPSTLTFTCAYSHALALSISLMLGASYLPYHSHHHSPPLHADSLTPILASTIPTLVLPSCHAHPLAPQALHACKHTYTWIHHMCMYAHMHDLTLALNTLVFPSCHACEHTYTWELSAWIHTHTCVILVSCNGWSGDTYSGSNNHPHVWTFSTKVNNSPYLLIWALSYVCKKWSPDSWLSIGPRVMRYG